MLRKISTKAIFLLIVLHAHGQVDPCVEHTPKKLSNAIDDCRPDNVTAKVCSARGECICGVCSCFYRPDPSEQIYGQYCECDNFSCDRAGGRICAGHGTCECGKCLCDHEWTGPACDCLATTATCIDPENSEVRCNDHGYCECGACRCHRDERGMYIGKYCKRYKRNGDSTDVEESIPTNSGTIRNSSEINL